MVTKLPHSEQEYSDLDHDNLVLFYKTTKDYEDNNPDFDGVVRLVRETEDGVWKIRKINERGPYGEDVAYFKNYEHWFLVSRSADQFIGQK